MEVAELKAKIGKILPDLETEKVDGLANYLHSKGLKSENRLKLVVVEDLLDHLDVFDARELVESFKSSQAEKQLSCTRKEHTTALGPREWDFEIDWSDIFKISKGFKNKLLSQKKITGQEQREVVKRLVCQVKESVPHCTRETFIQVGNDLNRRFPHTFMSILANGKMNRNAMCFKMQTKFDNDKRDKSRASLLETEAPHIKAAYGCCKWRLKTLPQNETAMTQEKKREEMEAYYQETRPSMWDMEQIEEEMAMTYGTLRKEINQQADHIQGLQKKKKKKKGNEQDVDDPDDEIFVTTEMLRNRWPFLFHGPFMISHFKTLTGVDLDKKLDDFKIDSVQKLLTFLSETNRDKKHTKKTTKKLNRAKAMRGEDKFYDVLAVLLLLLKRFGEDPTDLYQIVEDHVREDDIPSHCLVPKTPCIIIAGGKDIFDCAGKHIYFCMDATVLGTADTIESALKMLFAGYFVFNLMYAANAQITLEFIQRCIADISPPKGHKRPPKEAGEKDSDSESDTDNTLILEDD